MIFQYLIVVGTELRQNSYYYKIYVIYLNLVIHGIIPLLALVFLNSCVYWKLRKITQESANVHIQQQYVQMREVMLAKVSCIIVAGRNVIQALSFQISILSFPLLPQHQMDSKCLRAATERSCWNGQF